VRGLEFVVFLNIPFQALPYLNNFALQKFSHLWAKRTVIDTYPEIGIAVLQGKICKPDSVEGIPVKARLVHISIFGVPCDFPCILKFNRKVRKVYRKGRYIFLFCFLT
jgi:hypothetical protein